MPTINSLPVEKTLRVGANSEGYSRKKIIVPNVDTIASDSVASVTVDTGGSGYTSAPAVGFTGGNGSGAAATATLGFAVQSATLTNGGADYTTEPTVVFTGGGGTGAAGIAPIIEGEVSGVNITNGGSGYTSAPTISFTGGGGTGAAATAVLEPAGAVKSVAMTNGGEDYTSAPTVSFTGGAGTGATGTAVLSTNDDPVTTYLAFSPPLTTDDYILSAIPSQPCVISYANKTVEGVDIISTPLDGEGLEIGTMDVVIEFTS
jgi:hypothetical protein